MNERMRELELEAIAYADSKVPEDNRYNDIYHSIVRRCMAELIVRECFYCVEIMEKIAHASNADIPPDYDRQTYLKTLETVTGLLKAHFGVEE